jgi:predicted nucleic acid-binding Zn ribbon protein
MQFGMNRDRQNRDSMLFFIVGSIGLILGMLIMAIVS